MRRLGGKHLLVNHPVRSIGRHVCRPYELTRAQVGGELA
jgi:hypothetical protein